MKGGGLGGGAVNTVKVGDNRKGICGGDEDHGDSGDAGGEIIAKSEVVVWSQTHRSQMAQSPPQTHQINKMGVTRAVAGTATTTWVGR
ncbi:hypothetical protein Tco_0510467 [Tanacetum coccineum]|uniref:Uncharacterized protein n=1 Tax=Tanacetum coccineum TaxID=301880 RepID=A0ABQ5GIK0_9ASTR